MPGRLAKLARMERIRKRYLLAATAHLLRARVRHYRLSTKAILEDLQSAAPHATPTRSGAEPLDVALAAWAIATAARHVPWRADCLLQAMATTDWLRRHALAPTFHLGLQRSSSGELQAHAWLTLDGRILVGGSDSSIAPYVEILRPGTARPDTPPAA